MKKVTLMMMVFVLSLVMSSVTMAGGIKPEVKQATMKIEKVYYMKGSGYYVAHTIKDQNGRFWVLQVTDIALPKEDKTFTKALIKQYQGKDVIVTYTEPIDQDEEEEIVDVRVK